MKTRMIFAALTLGGIAVVIFLVGWFGFGAVWAALQRLGIRGLLAVAALHLVLMFLCGVAWRAVLPRERHVGVFVVTAARILRDAGAELLPISPAGGAVMGARALMLWRVSSGEAFGTTVVDMTLELFAQLCFTALGITLMWRFGWAPELGRTVLVGLGIAALLASGFVLAQRAGLFIMLERFTRRFMVKSAGTAPTPAASRGEGVHEAIHAAYRAHAGILMGFAWHVAGWIASTVETWAALKFLGAPLPFAAALALESLIQALRSAAFFVPSGWGVQEGGYVVLGALFGLAPEAALALSLTKRARELIIGIPALLLWQAAEARRWRRAGARPTT